MKRKRIAIVLSQESAFDNLACLSLQLEREGVDVEFVWPWIPGPIQGSPKEAARLLKSYNSNWELRMFKNVLDWKLYFWIRRFRNPLNFAHTPYIQDHYSIETQAFLSEAGPAYINYGINLEKSEATGFDLEAFTNFSPLLVANHSEAQKFLNRGVKKQNLVVTGMPGPFEVYRRSTQPFARGKEPPTAVFLWAPHWIAEWSTWEKVLPEILRFAKANRDVKIIVRAHPFLTAITTKKLPKEYRSSIGQSQQSVEMIYELLNLGNVSQSRTNMVEDCLRADWLLTDGVSIIAYWAATGKPLAISRKAGSPVFSKAFDLIGKNSSMIDTDRPHKIQEWLYERVKNHHYLISSELKNADLVAGSQYYYYEESSPGRIFAEWLSK